MSGGLEESGWIRWGRAMIQSRAARVAGTPETLILDHDDEFQVVEGL